MKFKVWDSVIKEFVNNDHLQLFYINYTGMLCQDGFGIIQAHPGFEVIHSTGKTDASGVELFEGDIGTPPFSDIKFVIVIKSWGIVFKSITDNGYYPLLSFLPSRMGDTELRFVKVGNKYENPELLEQ